MRADMSKIRNKSAYFSGVVSRFKEDGCESNSFFFTQEFVCEYTHVFCLVHSAVCLRARAFTLWSGYE